MIRRGFLLIVLAALVQVGIVACKNDDDDNEHPCKEGYYKLSYPVVADETANRASQSFTMRLRFQPLLYANTNSRSTGGFISEAVADHFCTDKNKGSYDMIKEIKITSNSNFDAAHPAGTSLNDLFLAKLPGVTEQIPLDSLLLNHLYYRSLLNGEPAAISLYNRFIDLSLNKWPANSETQIFFIRVVYTDGREFLGSSKEIKFKE